MIPESLQILEPIGAAIGFSILWYARSEDTDTFNPQHDWNWFKFGATLAVGLVVTIGMWAAGVDLSFAGFETRVTLYTGTIVIIQGALQALYRNVTNQ